MGKGWQKHLADSVERGAAKGEAKRKEKAARAAARVRNKRDKSPIAPPIETAELDPWSWQPSHLLRHFIELFREAYPELCHGFVRSWTSSVALPGFRKSKNFVKLLFLRIWMRRRLSRSALVTAKDLMDHAFVSRIRLEKNLKHLNGPIDAGFLLGYRRALHADMLGVSYIGPPSAAPKGQDRHTNNSDRWESTSPDFDL